MRAINAWVSNGKVYSFYRDEYDNIRFNRPADAEYSAFANGELPARMLDDNRVVSVVGDKVCFRDYKSRLEWRETHADAPLLEADVSPVKRWMADNDIDVQAPKRAFWDIESDSRVPFSHKEDARILCWTVLGANGEYKQGLLKEDTDFAEEALVADLLAAMNEYDQLAAWNGGTGGPNSDGFDLPVLEARCKRYNLRIDRRILFIDQMAAFKRMNLQTAGGGEEKQSFAIDSIGQALFGEGKTDFDGSKTWAAWSEGRTTELLAYNLQDCQLQKRIEEHTGYLDALQAICEVCHIFPNTHSLKPMSQHDGYLLRRARQIGTHLPSKPIGVIDTDDPFEGAYVRPPTMTGIRRDVSVVDFSGLYPSIITTLNICFSTVRASTGAVAPGSGVRFSQHTPGMLPSALLEYGKLRNHYNAIKKAAVPQSPEWKAADRFQNVFKVLRNGLYGILGNAYCRFHDLDMARSVTLTGQWLIKHVEEQVTARGWTVLYCDTDGCYFEGATTEESAAFAKWFTDEFIPAKMRELGCARCDIALSYQERFSRIVFPLGDDGEPVAKRYCARFSVYDGRPVTTKAVEVKGLEVKRGDASRLTRRLQQKIIDMLMDECEDVSQFERLVIETREQILHGQLDMADISISKSVKELSSYKVRYKKDGSLMNQPTYVEIAKKLLERGEDVSNGTRVRYIVLDGSTSPKTCIPEQDYTGECDRYYLWENCYPASARLLAGAFPKANWQRWKLKRPKKPLPGQLDLFGGLTA